ncbi:FGGY-family carbohydrate kinase [Convivina intestini]|uniref:Xylulokinase/glycerol kinase n=1 Tax=Convivina intestini TaxID=1505726 RepID=A0A2U1DEX9_9LACO|nr:FGGY-family carbohydrate kinase [Convivina intestini]PVY86139.1 xylulokinase/glycerol kinase [Convivina intestini]CAH1851432.1 Glycerol kinase [Convivina intestini]SDB81012.1 xylulokinase [Leuconostocaceae bacterium R-53105]
MNTYLIIDIGTSSIRGIIYDKTGKIIYKASQTYKPKYLPDGSVTQDPQIFIDLLIQIIKQCTVFARDNAYEIKAISMTSQRSSLIPTKGGQPIAQTIMWQDTRVNKILDQYRDYDDFFLQRSGSRLNAVYLGAKICWVKYQSPEIYAEADKMLNIPSLLLYQMTGTYTTDTTYGSRTNLMNIHDLTWDPDLFKILGLDVNKMPEITAPGDVCGYITEEFSQKTGLKKGLPVISAGGDQQCAAVGSGSITNDEVSINTGTRGYLIKNVDVLPKILDGNIIYNTSANPNKYILEIDLLACSSTLNWFIDNFYGERDFDKLNQDLSDCYGQHINLAVLPFHKGKSIGVYDTHIRAAFSNVGLSTRRKDMLYALMASLFVEINKGLGIFKANGPISSVIISGGLTNSTVMDQMQADAYNMPVHKTASVESTAIGALISVLVQQGEYANFHDAAQNIIDDPVQSYEPNLDNVQCLLDFDARNTNLYSNLQGTASGYYKE